MKYLLILALSGCSLTANFTMKCKGECEATVERSASSTPSLPIPKE